MWKKCGRNKKKPVLGLSWIDCNHFINVLEKQKSTIPSLLTSFYFNNINYITGGVGRSRAHVLILRTRVAEVSGKSVSCRNYYFHCDGACGAKCSSL